MSTGSIVSADDIVGLIGGSALSVGEVEEIFPFISKYVGVDGGAEAILSAGHVPSLILGDFDSISEHTLALFDDRLCHISNQDTTDFEKALTLLNPRAMIALGFTGGRLDHTLSVLNVLQRHPNQCVVLVDAHDASFLLTSGQIRLALPPGARISVMPLDEATVTLRGVKWSFEAANMKPGGFDSPSNMAIGGPVDVAAEGPVVVILPRGHLSDLLQAVVPEG